MDEDKEGSYTDVDADDGEDEMTATVATVEDGEDVGLEAVLLE